MHIDISFDTFADPHIGKVSYKLWWWEIYKYSGDQKDQISAIDIS